VDVQMKKNYVYQFKVTLKNIHPPIWRRIQVPSSYTFWDLHVAIQDAMGWLDYHLHCFQIINTATNEIAEIGIPTEDEFDDEYAPLAGNETRIEKYFTSHGQKAYYEYDFGDSWEHEIIFEKIVEKDNQKIYPQCLDGERACPPEDCGGVAGYQDILHILGNPSHEQYEEIRDWVGIYFDPEIFDKTAVHFSNSKRRWIDEFGGEY
jgi:hypothetical protein